MQLGLAKWFSNQDYQWYPNSYIYSDCSTTNAAITSQLQIGWYYFLCGMLSNCLVDLQQSFYTRISSKRSSRWAANLIKQLWSFLHRL